MKRQDEVDATHDAIVLAGKDMWGTGLGKHVETFPGGVKTV